MNDTEDKYSFPLERLSGGVRRRILLGVGATSLGLLIEFGARLLLVPMYLHAWGAEIFGRWQVLFAAAAYLALADFGGYLYISNSLTKAFTHMDMNRFRRVLHSGLAVFSVGSVLVVLCFVLIVRLSVAIGLFDFRGLGGNAALIALSILAFQIVFSLPEGILLAVLRAVGKLPTAAMFTNLLGILRVAFVGGGLLLGWGMVGVACLHVLPYAAIILLTLLVIMRMYPQLGLPSTGEARLSEMKAMVRPSMNFLLINLALLLSTHGPILVAGRLLGAVQVVVFSSMRTMANIMKQLMVLLVMSSWPEMTRLDAGRAIGKSHRLFKLMLRSSLSFAAVFSALLHIYGGEIFDFWLGGRVEFRQRTLDLIILYIFQVIFWTPSANFLMAANRHRAVSRVMFISSFLGILFASMGAKYCGMDGMVAGLIAGDLALCAWAIPVLLLKYREDISPGFYLGEIVPPLALLLGVFFSESFVFVAVPLAAAWWFYGYLSFGRAGK